MGFLSIILLYIVYGLFLVMIILLYTSVQHDVVLFNSSNTTGVTSGAGNANPSRAPEFFHFIL